MFKFMNIGKFLVLLTSCVTVLPLVLLLIGAMLHVCDGLKFETSTLGNLVNFKD